MKPRSQTRPFIVRSLQYIKYPSHPQHTAINDTKNILLAWVSAGTTLLSNVSDGLMPLVSAVVLPILFFAIGKTVDVVVQLYINRKRRVKGDE